MTSPDDVDMNSTEVRPDERCSPYGHDPGDLLAAQDEAAERVARLVAAMRASWQRDALCAESVVDLWFPGAGQPSSPALEICGRCSVRTECLAEALADPDLDHGIRGGATANARKLMRRNRELTGPEVTAPTLDQTPTADLDQTPTGTTTTTSKVTP